jgi:ISXO2-like transposase domain
MKRWGMGTFHGFRAKHLDRYLEEYAFRFNRRCWRRVSFERILGLALDHQPHGYAAVVGRRPRSNRANPPERKTPRRRKTAEGMRQDGAEKHAKRETLIRQADLS